ncbi:vesicle coat component [Emmonsiellopsis sp. PD_33]|nr:vesicle coat component [Emmonsiellopsis sp. PD_33]
MIQPGAWNPALRPDNSPERGALQPLSDDSTHSLSEKPSTDSLLPTESIKPANAGDLPADSANGVLSHDASEDPITDDLGGENVTTQEEDLSESQQGESIVNDVPPSSSLPDAQEPVQPAEAKPASTKEEVTIKPSVEEFQWDDDGDIDQAWGITSANTDLFERADLANRTNSFPSVDVTDDSNPHESNLPESTSESGAPDAGNQEPGGQSIPTTDNPYQTSDAHTDFMPWSATNVDEDNSGQFFNQLNTQTKPIYTPLEAESRFEEGMPLVNNTEPSSPTETSPTQQDQTASIDAIFNEDEVDDDSGFFTSNADTHPASPPPFGRKSTSQVLGSLHYEKDPSSVDSPTEIEAIEEKVEASDTQTTKEGPAEPPASEEDLAEMWKAALSDDDLLIEDDDLNGPSGQDQTQLNGVEEPANNYTNEPMQMSPSAQQHPQVNPYAPHQPSSSDLIGGLPATDYGLHNANTSTAPLPPPTRQYSGDSDSSKPESFSNRAKAGYKSPYDLPMDITRPKHPLVHRTSQPLPTMQPPPRKSSMTGTRPMSSGSAFAPPPAAPPPLARRETAGAPATNNFFEELPIAPRSRPSTQGRYSPQTIGQPVAPLPPTSVPQNMAAPPTLSPQTSDQFQLQKPERLDPYASLPVPAGPSGRYSPKPPSLHPGSKPPSSPRYSPAPPPSTGPPAANRYASQPTTSFPPASILPFQPRTSSPLAQPETGMSAAQAAPLPTRPSVAMAGPGPSSLHLAVESSPAVNTQQSQSTPPNQYVPGTGLGVAVSPQTMDHLPQQISPAPRNPYEPVAPSQPAPSAMSSHPPPPTGPTQYSPDQKPKPPRRSQTQSPSARRYEPNLVTQNEPFQRPASVHAPRPPLQLQPQPNSSSHDPVSSPQLDFVQPTDGQELDPLQRWKGAPIFKFGFGGIVATTFPKHIPRYSAGQLTPKIKSSPGEVKIRHTGEVVASTDTAMKFPGPLKSKSKKKDVVAWLTAKISAFENESLSLDTASQQQHNEKILLWKIVKVMVEHDGILTGTAEVENAVRSVLSPLPELAEPTSQSYSQPAQRSTGYRSISGTSQPETVNADGMESIRRNLLSGSREKAVWGAVDHRLWGHAMLISSTLDKSVWKQVVQEFVRREVRSAGDNTESLAALYEIFAGNLEESIDELVPPSARAGLQMVSKTDNPGNAKNALEGLDKWQETLALTLSNRSPDDHHALLALSRLLLSYGRVEASHLCALFAKSASTPLILSGPDDPQSHITLLGADHRRYPSTFANAQDPILLTEVYEFALSVLSGSPAAVLPHLQAFKLQYAISLAENGNKSDALQYCEAIGSILKSTTKPSPYYSQRFFSELEELHNRVRQSPADGSSSWMSKPSMEKVSGSMWARFNSFVAGDDSDGASTGSAKGADADIGPFAKVVGTPPVSRSPSVTEAYGSYFPSGQPIPAVQPTSRYAPGNQYAPYSSPDQYRGRSSLDSQRSPPVSGAGRSYSQRRPSQERSNTADGIYHPSAPHNVYNPAPTHGRHSTPPQSTYAPLAPVEENYPTENHGSPALEQPINFGGYQPSNLPQQPTFAEQASIEQEVSAALPQTTGYAPPSMTTGYEPPSYEPEPADSEESDKEKPKKKSFMDDDDDDFAVREAAMKKAEKERKDREADEAFRKAAEEDAKKPAPEKKGWFSWLGRGKDPNPHTGGPIRAKLGEENSFYYDKELKRWVNKKDPNSATATAHSTPPPPKGTAPSSRSASSGAGPPPAGNIPTSGSAPILMPPSNPPSGPPSQAGGLSPLNMSPSLSSLAVPPSASPHLMPRSVSAGMAPPSRPGTALSNASSIDDLLGAPQPRKGNTVKAKKKGRGYIDVMAK